MSKIRAVANAAKFVLREITAGKNVLEELLGTSKVLHPGNLGCEIVDGYISGGNGGAPSVLGKKLWAYATRAAGAVPNGGAVLAPAEMASVVAGDLAYLKGLGLAGDVRVITLKGDKTRPLMDLALEDVNGIRAQLSGLQEGVIFPFIGSEKVNRLARELGMRAVPDNIVAVGKVNNKGYCLQELLKRRVPVPYGHWVRGCGYDRARAQFLDVFAHSPDRRVFVKLGRAASGQGVREVNSIEGFQRLLETDSRFLDQLRSKEIGLRIDAAVDAEKFPNVMVWIGDKPQDHRFVTASQQILIKNDPSDLVATVHAGNLGPLHGELKDMLMPSVRTSVDWLHKIGFRGLAGIDFAVDQQRGIAYVLEINGRVNGNNPAFFMTHGLRFAPRVWGANNTIVVPTGTTREMYVNHLVGQGIHFNQISGEGVFVVNSATGPAGAMQVGLGASSHVQAQRFLEGAAKFAAMLVLGDLASLFFDQAA